MLDLGKVGDLAEVTVNGKPVGSAWRAPYRVDVSRAVRPGRNSLTVKVANLWVNRLIGDVQPGATKVAFTAVPTYLPNAPLRPSGLIGPVTLLTSQVGATAKKVVAKKAVTRSFGVKSTTAKSAAAKSAPAKRSTARQRA